MGGLQGAPGGGQVYPPLLLALATASEPSSPYQQRRGPPTCLPGVLSSGQGLCPEAKERHRAVAKVTNC